MFIVRSYDHLYAMDDKGKTTLICMEQLILSDLVCGLISYVTMRHHKFNLIQLAVPHTNVVCLIIYNVQQGLKYINISTCPAG